ncbi:FAD-linked oxidases family protein [Actinidia rufa]|uniref:FAD-linked oxidases family protein n=1 Tax=Actinidia rufa TaxID=165716 RepID=A0A7J0GEQ1_9ERIC|nr:FAD-linked oxidases family protein [Actinidia rufa]
MGTLFSSNCRRGLIRITRPPDPEQPMGVSFVGKGSTEYLVKGARKEVPQELIDELKAICQDSMTMDFDERYFHGKPQNSFHKAVNIPDVVVFPR